MGLEGVSMIVWNVRGLWAFAPHYQRGRQLSMDRAAGQKQACGSVMETVRRQQPAQQGTLSWYMVCILSWCVLCCLTTITLTDRLQTNVGSHPA